ncbi:alpha/beta fold hydrolase [Rubrivirga sp.]|uniref:alpha/beta fold hydrolase n=1 Tax=Rubrivirga sp. TaxID=1885344 RepID=UPI003B516F29
MRLRHALAVLVALSGLAASAQTELAVEPYTFTADDGRTVEAELGRFRVPENRQRPAGRTIGLAFVRFPSTSPTPGPPIVYLAGGPGGSGTGTAEGTRFDLFQSLRAVADVIAFDQRGTGFSDRLPECPHEVALPLDVPGTRAATDAAWAEGTRACAAHWRRLGVDLAAYNTDESADDLDALRHVLGADRVSLWAISYGTHLALVTIRRHPDAVARAVLAGVEGPDHTLKLPSHQQVLLEQIDAGHRAQNPEASFLADVEAVLDRLRAAPVVVDAEVEGETVGLAIGAFDVQWLAANMLGGPELSMQLPGLFAAMRAGDFSTVASWIVYLKQPSGIAAMSSAMDAASGASLWRRARIASEARRTLLGDAINAPGPAQSVALGVPDLGPAFRAPVASDVPVLFISGTLDGRTPVANADEVSAGFSDHAHLVIEGAGHSDPLFLGSPVILERMLSFFGGAAVESETVHLAP